MSTKKKGAEGPPTLPDIGTELRKVVQCLEGIRSHVVVCIKALQKQNADDDWDAAEVLRVSVSFPLYTQRQRLARLASRCDGKPVEDEYIDDDSEPDDGADQG